MKVNGFQLFLLLNGMFCLGLAFMYKLANPYSGVKLFSVSMIGIYLLFYVIWDVFAMNRKLNRQLAILEKLNEESNEMVKETVEMTK